MLCQILKIRHIGIVMRQDLLRKFFDLSKAHRFPPQVMPSNSCGFDAAAHGQVLHCAAFLLVSPSNSFSTHIALYLSYSISQTLTVQRGPTFCQP